MVIGQVMKKPNKEVGKKHDKGKIKLSLIPVEFMMGLGRALTHGASKYGSHNFRNKGLTLSQLLDAANRHHLLEVAGVDKDKESGLPHWAHAAASYAMYAFIKRWYPDMDDRYQYTDEEKQLIEKELYETT
jgi:hypothetical protein